MSASNWQQLVPQVAPKVVHYFDPNTVGYNLETIAGELVPAPPGQETSTSWIPPIVVPAPAAGKVGQLPPNAVKNAIIQNISTSPVTLTGPSGGAGFILNAASGAGNAGDAVTIGPQGNDENLQLSQVFFTTAGTGNVLSVLILA